MSRTSKKVIQVWVAFAVLAVVVGLFTLKLRNYPPVPEIDAKYHIPTLITLGWVSLIVGIVLLIGLPLFSFILYQRKLINEQIGRTNRGRLIYRTWGVRPKFQLIRRKK